MTDNKNHGLYRVLTGFCPDEKCQAKLFFPAYDSSIECTNCGQRRERSSLKNVEEVTNPDVALHNILRNILLGNTKPKKGTDSVKVLGLSNYQCKLVSPLLTRYGMDKQGKAQLLTDMGRGDTFDCSILGDRAFLIEAENIEISGYGRDKTGSMNYLKQTLDAVKETNGQEERLLPIHADGDGHCLVHALSRSLIGRELFWHALRENLKTHFQVNIETYKRMFCDFVDKDEWIDIIEECDADYVPQFGEPLGLRNIHIFGLANVLRRPIILLDSISGIQSSGDYTGVFLPGLSPPEKCRGKDCSLNKPLCLAWSSSGRNHYIALVGVKGRPLPRLPRWMLPKVWGMPQDQIHLYIDFDDKGCCTIGGDKCLQDKYILRLVSAMEEVFKKEYGVSPQLVADVHQYVYKNTGMVGIKPEIVLAETQRVVGENRLYRCLTCDALAIFNVSTDQLRPTGSLYMLAVKIHGKLKPEKRYSFPTHGLICEYDNVRDILVPDFKQSQLTNCNWCKGTQMRHVNGEGNIQYINGDRTSTRARQSRCQCGFKHYYDGQEYDNLPEIFPVTLEWNGKVVGEKVVWFQYESDPSKNSNVYEIAHKLVQKHFPGEFGSERLVQKVVDSILHQTEHKDEEEQPDGTTASTSSGWAPDSPSKIILTGQAKKVLHKEELIKSQTEKSLHQRVQQKAAISQRRRTDELERQQAKSSPTRVTAKQQKLGGGSSQSSSPPAPTQPTAKKPEVAPDNSAQKKVRVSTSDGRQLVLLLDGQTTYAELETKLESELSVPRSRQRIKYGFPPKVLKAPESGQEDESVPLQNGDRLTVEILSDSVSDTATPMASSSTSGDALPGAMGWNTWSQEGHPHSRQDTTEQLLKGLSELQNSSIDSLDTSIASLTLLATLTGKDLWTYVESMPNLFTVGGLFYEQVKRDLGLVENKHFKLPCLQKRTFRYSEAEDRLELCLEPLGHFPIQPGIGEIEKTLGDFTAQLSSSEQLKMSTFSNFQLPDAEVKQAVSAGGSGIVVNKPMKYPNTTQAFTGQGHTLASSSTEAEGSKLTVMEFEENTPATEAKSETNPVFTRVGPGYTVLNRQVENEVNLASEAFRSIATSIEAAVIETEFDMESDQRQDDMNIGEKSESHVESTNNPSENISDSQIDKHSVEMHHTQDADSETGSQCDQSETPTSNSKNLETDPHESKTSTLEQMDSS